MNKETDVTLRKLFIGGLPFHTTDKSLREHFEQYGGIEEAVVISDRTTGKSKGYGFVTMADRDAADKACAMKNPTIDGRKANVNLAYLGAKPRRAHMPTGGGYLPLTSYGSQGMGGNPMTVDQVQQQHLAYQQAYLQMQQYQQMQLQQQLAMAGQSVGGMGVNGVQHLSGFHDFAQPPPLLTNGHAASFGVQGPGAAGYGQFMGSSQPTSIPQQGGTKFEQLQLGGQSPNMTNFIQPGSSPIGSMSSYSAPSPQMYMPQ